MIKPVIIRTSSPPIPLVDQEKIAVLLAARQAGCTRPFLLLLSSAPACARALPTVCSGPVTTPGRTTLHLRLFRASGASSLRLALAAIAEATSLHLGMAALLELVGPPSLRLTLAVLRALGGLSAVHAPFGNPGTWR